MKFFLQIICVFFSFLCLLKAFSYAAPTPSLPGVQSNQLDYNKLRNLSIIYDELEKDKNTDCNLLVEKVEKSAYKVLEEPKSPSATPEEIRIWHRANPIISGPDGIKSTIVPVKEQTLLMCELLKRPEEWKEFRDTLSQFPPIDYATKLNETLQKLEKKFQHNPSLEHTFLRLKDSMLEGQRRQQILKEKLFDALFTF